MSGRVGSRVYARGMTSVVACMINRLIDVALKNRFIVVVLYLGLAGWGWWALTSTPIDAIPDLSDNQVIVFTDWSGHSPQEVEDQVTYPLTTNLQGLAGVRVVRSQSAFGFSMIYVVFEDNVELYFARARVLERMSLVTKSLPTGVTPTLGPDATGVGHVFWYTVESPTHSLRELRTLQDWFIRYQLNSVPGVAEVASVGGHVQQYQVDVDPNRLRNYNLPFSAVVSAVRASNLNVGGNVLESNGAWLIVRGVGLIASVDDIKRIVVGGSNGVPIYVEQVANVQIGNAFRVASLVKGTQEAVGGVVVARTGVNTKDVIDAVKARIAQIAPGLPPGVTIVPFYDRSDLIEQAVGTLRHRADRGDRARDAGARHLPDARSLDSDRHASVAPRRPDVVPGHVLRRDLLQHHEPRRHRHRDWRARRCGHRRDGERVPIRRAARCRSWRSSPNLGDRSRLHAIGRAARVLLDGDHPARLHSGLCADWPRRQVVSPSSLHQDVCGACGDGHRRHARSGAVHVATRGKVPSGRGQPRDARPSRRLPACAAERARASGHSQSRRPWFSLSERWSWRVGSAASSCRRSTRAI